MTHLLYRPGDPVRIGASEDRRPDRVLYRFFWFGPETVADKSLEGGVS